MLKLIHFTLIISLCQSRLIRQDGGKFTPSQRIPLVPKFVVFENEQNDLIENEIFNEITEEEKPVVKRHNPKYPKEQKEITEPRQIKGQFMMFLRVIQFF